MYIVREIDMETVKYSGINYSINSMSLEYVIMSKKFKKVEYNIEPQNIIQTPYFVYVW